MILQKEFLFLKLSSLVLNGGESHKVGELSSGVTFELEAYPEPKILTSAELKRLLDIFGTTVAVSKFLGCSQSFVSERLKVIKKNKTKGDK
jgi:hypothetical protein